MPPPATLNAPRCRCPESQRNSIQRLSTGTGVLKALIRRNRSYRRAADLSPSSVSSRSLSSVRKRLIVRRDEKTLNARCSLRLNTSGYSEFYCVRLRRRAGPEILQDEFGSFPTTMSRDEAFVAPMGLTCLGRGLDIQVRRKSWLLVQSPDARSRGRIIPQDIGSRCAELSGVPDAADDAAQESESSRPTRHQSVYATTGAVRAGRAADDDELVARLVDRIATGDADRGGARLPWFHRRCGWRHCAAR